MGWGKSAQVSDLGEILDCSQAHGDLVWAWGIENLLIKAIKAVETCRTDHRRQYTETKD